MFLHFAAQAQLGGRAGVYSRMGFGAEGIGMGNARIATAAGDVFAYYNPAVLPYAEHKTLAADLGILALDRKLNFLSYSQAVAPDAGIAIAIINSGVSEIDGRDSDGEPTGLLRTSENQAILSFATRFKAGFSAGINLKFLHHHLYTDVNTFTVGIDVGVFVPVTTDFKFGATVRDINSKYKWDTTTLYGQSGNSTTDEFPLLYTFGASYDLPAVNATIEADVEFSNESTTIGRAGIQLEILPELIVRGGVDRIDLKEKGQGVKPALGLTLRTHPGDTIPLISPDAIAFNYAYVFEPFASQKIHMIGLSIRI
jgi:hypothetical protein